jgi:tryptophan synthase alpha chain
MGRIDDIFSTLRTQRRRALMPFVCGGHPGPGALAQVLPALQRAGASIVEVGFPFSDPIADGPVIAAAMHKALLAGATPASVMDEVASIRSTLDIGVVAMVSVSIVLRMGGPAAFVNKAAAAGFDGFIFPDAPLEESAALVQPAIDAGLSASLLIAPTTPIRRVERIASLSRGFLYLLARSGITGESSAAPDIAARVAEIRQLTPLPIACGFGISTPAHIRAVVQDGAADAAIVGSALVRRIDDAATVGRDPIAEAESFVRDLAGGLT